MFNIYLTNTKIKEHILKKLFIIMLSVGLFMSVAFAEENNLNKKIWDPVITTQKAVFVGVSGVFPESEKSCEVSFINNITWEYDITEPDPVPAVYCLQYREHLFLYSQDIKANYKIKLSSVNYVSANIFLKRFDVMLC
jgi:hypothetical protein